MIIPIAVIVANLIDVIIGGRMATFVQLTPSLILTVGEFHRILLYPFISSEVADLAILAYAFTICSVFFERTFKSKIYPILLLIVSVFFGLVYTLAFLKLDVTFSGMAPVSFFLISLHTFINMKTKISTKTGYIHTNWFNLAAVGFWVALLIIPNVSNSFMTFIPHLASLIFGSASGGISFLFIRHLYRQNNSSSLIDEMERYPSIPNPDELTPALISANRIEKLLDKEKEVLYTKKTFFSQDPEENEHELNKILEKISAEGKEALTDEEKQFLDLYSQNM